MYRHCIKKILDLFIAVIGLAVCCLPMIVIAVLIKTDSKGPVLFRQQRLGKDRKPFTICKFRTMCDNAYAKGGVAVSADDSRITRAGAFLRRTSLDELPQFFNIISGTMSVIGPRPILATEWEEYKDDRRFSRRYDVLPGMFCTIDLKNRAAERKQQFEEDARYAENVNFLTDIKTFFGIIPVVFSGKHVYMDER